MREDKQIENREVQSFLVPPVTTPVGGDYGVENKAQVSPADQQGPRPHLKASRILYTKKAIYPQCGATIKAALKKKKKVQLFHSALFSLVLHVHSDSVQL